MNVRGKVLKFNDNVDTDVIIPARYLNSSDPEHLRRHCMEDIDETFASRVCKGDIIVAGRNFGCGSSREHAPVAIKASGVSLVIASDFARIFYRNAITVGLAILECEKASEEVEEGDMLEVDFDTGIINDLTSNRTYKANAFPDFVKRIIDCGGLVGYTKEEIRKG